MLAIEDAPAGESKAVNFPTTSMIRPLVGREWLRGGMLLKQVTRSVVRKNRANRDRDGCVLVGSDDTSSKRTIFPRLEHLL